MTLRVNQEADALYLRLDDSSVVESEEVSPGIVLRDLRTSGLASSYPASSDNGV